MNYDKLRRDNKKYYRQIRSVHYVSALENILQKIDANLKVFPVTQKNSFNDINVYKKSTKKALLIYCEFGELLLFKWLYKHRQKYDISINLWVPFMDIACEKNYLHMIKYVVSLGGQPTYEYFKAACKTGYVHQVRYFIDYYSSKTDINDGFDIACEFGQANIAKCLIDEYGINRKHLEEGLITACQLGYNDVIFVLIERDAPWHILNSRYTKRIKADIRYVQSKYHKAIDKYMYTDLNRLTMKYIMHPNLRQFGKAKSS